MSVAFTDTFDESRLADLARSLRLMAAAVPPEGTVEVTLTPVAARLVARSIEAGLHADSIAKASGRPDTGSRSADMILRQRTRQQWAIAGLAAALAISFVVLLVLR